MPPVTKTYWNIEVIVVEGDRERCVVGSGQADLPHAIAALYHDATYYQTECGYTVRGTITKMCGHCEGGTTAGRRPFQRKVCKFCKGQPALQVIDTPVLSDRYTRVPA